MEEKGNTQHTNTYANNFQYTKSMLDINPKGITPLGPYPAIDPGVPSEEEWKDLKPKGVQMKEIMEAAGKLSVEPGQVQ